VPVVKNQEVPKARRDDWDSEQPGLVKRVSPTSKVWYVVYRFKGRKRRLKVGDTKTWPVRRARVRAKELLQMLPGTDPAELQDQEDGDVPTVEELVEAFITDQAEDWRPATRAGWERFLRVEVIPGLGAKADPATVEAADVHRFIRRIERGVPGKRKPAPVSAKRCYEVTRRLFAWAADPTCWKPAIPNPLQATLPFERGKRSGRRKAKPHVLPFTNEQLRGIFAAAKGQRGEHLLELIALCGTRDFETRSAEWSEFDLERNVWTIPPSKSKTGDTHGKPHVVPLSSGVLRVLAGVREDNLKAGMGRSRYLFPAVVWRLHGTKRKLDRTAKLTFMDKANKLARDVKAAAGIEDRGLLHRFRHTLSTRLAEHGTDARVIEHVLGHVVPGIRGVYDHAEMLPQRRKALEWWSAELDRITKALDSAARDA
jgi:integrase